MTVNEPNSVPALPGPIVPDLCPAFPAQEAQEVQEVQEDALERLLAVLHSAGTLFLLRAPSRACADWLTVARIDRHVREALMEPAQTDIWPLLPDAWAISLDLEGDIKQPAAALHIHSLRRTLTDRLEAEWQAELAARPEAERETEWQAEAAPIPNQGVHPRFSAGGTQSSIINRQSPIANRQSM